jgi:hypothetical protein
MIFGRSFVILSARAVTLFLDILISFGFLSTKSQRHEGFFRVENQNYLLVTWRLRGRNTGAIFTPIIS